MDLVRWMLANGYRVSPDVANHAVASGNGRLVEDLILYEGAPFDTDTAMIATATRRHGILRMLADFDSAHRHIRDARVICFCLHIIANEPPIWGHLTHGGMVRVLNHAHDAVDPPGFDTEDYESPNSHTSTDTDPDEDEYLE